MGQELTTSSTPAFIAAKVRSFIHADADGSQRVDTSGMQAYLSEQFGYLTASGASPASKDVMAAYLANFLQGAVGREAWRSNPNYPASSGGNPAVVAALADLQRQAATLTSAITSAYQAFDSSVQGRVKSLFNMVVAPNFPPGTERVETTRAYIETFVTDWGEESRPSPISALVTMDQNDTITITGNAAPAGRHVTLRRLYRSATGNASSAFLLQGEYPIAQNSITDDKPDTQLDESCPTFGWLEPPANLQGLIGMSNGVMVGFVGNTLYVCEPYKPYAYPAAYDKPLPHQIVGMVALDQSAFIGTVKYPYLLTGADSASLSEQKLNDLIPCASARSMVAVSGAVFYASSDGLALYENGSVSIVSDGIDRKTWQSYNPASMHAAGFDGRYIVFYDRADGSRGALMFDYKARALVALDQRADAVFSNQDGIYFLDGGTIYDLMPASGAPRAGHFHTKTFRLPAPASFTWVQVAGEGLAANPATIRLYADFEDGKGMVLHYTATLASKQAVRSKPGRATEWRIEIESAATISSVTLATTTEELKAAQ
jgi:hypothetical protein